MTSPSPPTTAPARTLRRSRSDRIIGGVCGGLGRYLGIDPVLIRIVAVVLALASGVGVLAYLIAWIAVPDSETEPEAARPPAAPAAAALVAGAVLIVVGGMLLVRRFVPWFEMDVLWPTVIVGAGLLVLVTGLHRRRDR